jgi:AraC-like DNA-binding protein
MIGSSATVGQPADPAASRNETIRYERRPDLPGVELRTVCNSARSFHFYSTGFEFLAPGTWRGEIWHRRCRHVVEPGWVLSARPGDVFVTERVHEPGCWSSLTIDGDALGSYVAERAAWDRVELRPFARMSEGLARRLSGVIRALQARAEPAEVRAALTDFLDGVFGEIVDRDALVRPAAGGGLPSRAAERFACFRRETPGRVALADLTDETGLSRFQVLRAFKRQFGLAPRTYQLRVRLGIAQKLLRAGGLPADVAAELGFVDQSHLTRHFKRFLGVTPAKYARGGTHRLRLPDAVAA